MYTNIYMEPGLSRGPGVGVERAAPEVWYSSSGAPLITVVDSCAYS